ncbi:hypothetical protein Tco_0273068 [Tanacetum coccineum]
MHIGKNALEAILNTLLMNDKSKDTAKARQDLKKLGIRSGLWLGQTKNGKCSKPRAAYSFSPENRKKFCQFIKGVKLPDGFGSNFKHKVTDNDTKITGLKSHDCHIMMQRLLPYGLQQYLPDEDDMLTRAEQEALEGGPIRPRWMFPFERFMKKLKGYVRNKAKPEGSIAEGYVAEEALTFSSHYFWDVTTKFNRPDRNVDPPPPTPEIDTYRSQFKSKFPNKDMKEEFPNWFGSQIWQTTTPNWTVARACESEKVLEGCIVVEEDPDVIHFDNSSDLPLSTSLNDLNNATLHIDGQSTEVDAPPDIIDLDEDDDIIDDEDALPHDLADSDDEDLVNVEDDDGVEVVYSSEEED